MKPIVSRAGLFIIGIGLVAALSLLIFSTPDLPRSKLEQKYTNEQSRFLDWDDGTRLHYRDQGNPDGIAVILIHGSNASLHTWEPWVKELGDTFRLISIDLPGHGLTGPVPHSRYSIEDMSQFTLKLMDALGIPQAYLAGNSMGGAVSLRLTLDNPRRVRGLILISSAGMRRDIGDEPVGAFKLAQSAIGREMLRRITPRFMVEDTIRKIVAAPDQFITEDMVTRYWELMRLEGTREASLIRFAGYPAAEPLEPHLGDITQPALILWGQKDTLIRPIYGERMHDVMQNSRLIIYENAGHMAMEELPTQTAMATRAFIDETSSGR